MGESRNQMTISTALTARSTARALGVSGCASALQCDELYHTRTHGMVVVLVRLSLHLWSSQKGSTFHIQTIVSHFTIEMLPGLFEGQINFTGWVGSVSPDSTREIVEAS